MSFPCRIKPYFRRLIGTLLLVIAFSALTACRQDMAAQPKANPLTASTFFRNGGAARPLVAGTVPHGSTAEDYLDVSPDEVAFPVPVTPVLLSRGRERFEIFCSECHGLLGNGDGMIVRRGFSQPPSYHIDRLRSAPVGHFYNVITYGYGRMPEYASQVPKLDRWAIVAYIRALQLSQYASASELTPEDLVKISQASSGRTTQAASQVSGVHQ